MSYYFIYKLFFSMAISSTDPVNSADETSTNPNNNGGSKVQTNDATKSSNEDLNKHEWPVAAPTIENDIELNLDLEPVRIWENEEWNKDTSEIKIEINENIEEKKTLLGETKDKIIDKKNNDDLSFDLPTLDEVEKTEDKDWLDKEDEKEKKEDTMNKVEINDITKNKTIVWIDTLAAPVDINSSVVDEARKVNIEDVSPLTKKVENLVIPTTLENNITPSAPIIENPIPTKFSETPMTPTPTQNTFSLDDLDLSQPSSFGTNQIVTDTTSAVIQPQVVPNQAQKNPTQIPAAPDSSWLDLSAISMQKIQWTENIQTAGTPVNPTNFWIPSTTPLDIWQVPQINSTVTMTVPQATIPQTNIVPQANSQGKNLLNKKISKNRKIASSFVLFLLIIGGGGYIFSTMYPVEFQNMKDKMFSKSNNSTEELIVNTNEIESNIEWESNIAINDDNEFVHESAVDTWNETDLQLDKPSWWELSGDIVIQESIVDKKETVEENNNIDPFEALDEAVNTESPYQWMIDQLQYYAEEWISYMDLAEKIEDTSMRKLALVLTKKAPEHIITLEAGNVDQDKLDVIERHLELFKNYLDKLSVMVEEIPASPTINVWDLNNIVDNNVDVNTPVDF